MTLTAYKIGDEFALTFVKVLDEMSLGLVDEDEPVAEPTDRTFWETATNAARSSHCFLLPVMRGIRQY